MNSQFDPTISASSRLEKTAEQRIEGHSKSRPDGGQGQARNQILNWVEHGHLAAGRTEQAFGIAGLLPDRRDWLRFIDNLLLWSGSVSVAAGVIFFLAYNWQSLGHYAKFGLVETLIVLTIALYWFLGDERLAGKAALLGASLLVGALFALFGQTYQTGADTFELFLSWSMAILPWVAVARLPALWLLFLFLLNMATFLYLHIFPRWFGLFWDLDRMVWFGFILNSLALILWEFAASCGIVWLRQRWAPRIIGLASGVTITVWADISILDARILSKPATMIGYFLWLAIVYLYYRRRNHDLFFLAAWVLSLIVSATTLLSRILLDSFHWDEVALLIISLSVIAMSAWGGVWLKRVAREEVA